MNRKALVIGINSYPYLPKGRLEVPADDAEKMAQLLTQYGYFHPIYRFPEEMQHDGENLRSCVTSEVCKTEDLKKKIENLFKPPSKDIPYTALLFFAGHGLFDDNGELILATSQAGSRKKEWGISLEWLCDVLKASPVQQQIVWLDCCNSGKWIELAKDRLSNSDKQLFFITATTSYEPAFAGTQGVLTNILLQGLDPTKDSEGLITHNKLKRFIEDNQPTIPQKIIVHSSSTSEIYLTCTEKYKLESLLLKEQQGSCQTPTITQPVKSQKKSSQNKKPINQKKKTPKQEEKFSQLLLTLDYDFQSGLFDTFFKRSPMAAFLIHGKPQCAQSWLQHRLTKRVEMEQRNCRTQEYKFLDLCSNGTIDPLLRKIGANFSIYTKSPSTEEIAQEIAQAICNNLESETVILVLKDICKKYEESLKEFIDKFWYPLVALAKRKQPKFSNNKLLMFLVDSTGNLEEWKIPFVELEKDIATWEPHIPVKLPQIEPLNDYLIAHWLESNKNKLPDELTVSINDAALRLFSNSHDGLHDWVFHQICEECGYSWDKINQKG